MTRNDDTVNGARRRVMQVTAAGVAAGLAGCMHDGGDGAMEGDDAMQGGSMEATDTGTAERVAIDRFSDAAGTLFVRSQNPELPGPDEPIDFDQGPFHTRGLGPDGAAVEYYNFDVQPTAPAPIWVPFREGADAPVEDQLNIVDVVPGDQGYNDFWRVHKVTVPEDYEANALTSASDVREAGHDVTPTETLVNCPIVPEGSTASERYGDGDADLVQGWYDGKVVTYFTFEEAPLAVADGAVPTSPIYVSFNTNPGRDGGGPASGFMTEEGSDQTHNVVATVPDAEAYSPLWSVNPYDNADFDAVSDLDSATSADVLASGTATVNCPVVAVHGDAMDGSMEGSMDGEGPMEGDGAMENDSMDGSMDGSMEG